MTLGHNNPPTDADILNDYLKSNNSDLLEEVLEIEALKGFLPSPIETDDQEIEIQDFIKRANTCTKDLEASREKNKSPYLQAGKTVDEFFKSYKTSTEAMAADLKKPLLSYKQKKADEEKRLADIEAARLQEIADAKALEATVQEALGDSTANTLLDEALKVEKEAIKVSDFVSRGTAKSAVSSGGIKKRTVGEIQDLNKLDIIKLKKYFTTDSIQKAINAMVADGVTECEGVLIYEKQEVVVR